MAASILMAYVGLTVLAVVVAWLVVQRARRGVYTSRQGSEVLCTAVQSAKRRFIITVGFTAVLLFAAYALTIAFPATLGLPLAVAPSVAGAAGLLLYVVTPPPVAPTAEGDLRVASLTPRHAWSFASRRALSGLVVLFAATCALLIATGLTSSPDDTGLYRSITLVNGTLATSAGPYPGWFYAVPLLVVLACLMVVALLALRRIAVTPSLPGPGLERQDRAWRVESTRIVINVLTASLALQLGGVAVFAGDAIRNAAITPEEPFDMHTFGVALLVIGIVALAFSVIWFTLAAVRAFELPHTVAAEVATESTTQEAMDDDHARSL